MVEEHHAQSDQHGPVVRSTVKTESARLASPGGVEALPRVCAACGGTATDPEATSCPHCGANLPSYDDVVKKAAARPPTSAEAIAKWRLSLAKLDISPPLRAVMLAAESQILAGCPSCQGGLMVREHKGARLERRAVLKFGRRQSAFRSNAPQTTAAPTYTLDCPNCGFSRPLPAPST